MCGVFGIYDHPEAANFTYLGLHALQHRGQESAGIVSNDQGNLHAVRKMGHVADIFNANKLGHLKGNTAIGHVRYSTTGGSLPRNIQPLTVELHEGPVAISHNGNLVNAGSLRNELEKEGAIFSSNADTEVILHLMARSSEEDFCSQLVDALYHVKGAYCVVLTMGDQLLAARDPHGFRPLSLGKVKGTNSWVVASETCAFDLIEAEFIRDVEPGEVISIDKEGVRTISKRKGSKFGCVFEKVYFARPDSEIDSAPTYDARFRMGRQLALEHPVDADVVIPVPDSGMVSALGFAKESNLPFEIGLIRNHYVGRTFIEPKESIRNFGVKLKLNPVSKLLKDKRVVVVDDSIVRGTTSGKIVKMIRDAGAKEIHVRISSPPVIQSCYYGIDTPTREELVAANNTIEGVRNYIKADTLGYLSLHGLLLAVQDENDQRHCSACFTGNYPIEVEKPVKIRPHRLVEI